MCNGMLNQHAQRTHGRATSAKGPAGALPTLSWVKQYAPFIVPALTRLTLDKYQDMLLDWALEYLIGSPMPEVAYDGDKIAIGAGFSYALDELRYRMLRRSAGQPPARLRTKAAASRKMPRTKP